MANKEDEEIKKLFWLDMEMTGLNPQICKIIEVAVIITDLNFEPIDKYERIVHQPKEIMDQMDDWCKKTHGESGLTEAVAKGTPQNEVEQELIALGEKHFKKDKIVLCGNSIGHDKKFIDAHMSKFSSNLHYRIVDVSSFKSIFQGKYGITVEKKERHRALDDIKESISELKHYLSYVKTS